MGKRAEVDDALSESRPEARPVSPAFSARLHNRRATFFPFPIVSLPASLEAWFSSLSAVAPCCFSPFH